MNIKMSDLINGQKKAEDSKFSRHGEFNRCYGRTVVVCGMLMCAIPIAVNAIEDFLNAGDEQPKNGGDRSNGGGRYGNEGRGRR